MQPNANRERAMHAILACPGVSFRALGRATGIPAGTLVHHLRILKRARRIVERPLGVRRTFYPAGSAIPDPIEEVCRREPYLEQLRLWIDANPGSTQMDVLAAFAWAHSTTQHRLHRLVALGAVRRVPVGLRSVAYYRQHRKAPPPGLVGHRVSEVVA